MRGTAWALALADFRERRRRPAYLAVLLGTIAFGLLAAPIGTSTWQIFQISGYRGLYTSGYVGTVTALGGAVWLTLAGFGVTRGTVVKDARTGVGQILAATPMSRAAYLSGKYVSNLLLLGSALLALAATALAAQLLKGESYTVDVVRLLLPFALITLPLLTVVAACAVLFDTLPVLRGGAGSLVWFAVWMGGVLASQSARGYDLLGMRWIGESMRHAIEAAGHPSDSVTFGVGLTSIDTPPVPFAWDGPGLGDLGGAPVAGAGALTAGSVVLALLAALWFRRFDSAAVPRGVLHALRGNLAGGTPPAAVEPAPETVPAPSFEFDPARMTPPRTGAAFLPVLVGELRILLQGTRWWWWLGALAITLIALVVPAGNVVHPVLALAMLWPVLVWSRMGGHTDSGSLGDLLTACPAAGRRLLGGLLAGIVLALAVSALPVLRLLAAGDAAAVAAALAGALLVPALAMLCGVVTRGPRFFQALYPLLWYAMFNGVTEVDFLGASPGEGPGPAAVASAAVVLGLAAAGVDALRHARR